MRGIRWTLVSALILAFATSAAAQSAAAPSAAASTITRERATLCYGHAVRDIRVSSEAHGRVPGPAWQVQDFWRERLGEDPREDGVRQAEAIDARAAADPGGVEQEGVACAHQALDALEQDGR